MIWKSTFPFRPGAHWEKITRRGAVPYSMMYYKESTRYGGRKDLVTGEKLLPLTESGGKMWKFKFDFLPSNEKNGWSLMVNYIWVVKMEQ
ncbi:MAG: hypothetical protein CM15mP8_0460 [Methanobacteriota archaeon]|nr:MAG: hypothetical protein CM15mP8_0460 [Euryarchaeota archaeon]